MTSEKSAISVKPIKIHKAELYSTAVGPSGYPVGGLPEIALAGRSNVGKSSLINYLINRKGLAHTSGTPGKTQTLNFYCINDTFYFADLPGYGYAKSSKADRARWGRFIEAYLSARSELAGVILLVDLRHPPMESDKMMMEWLSHYRFPILVAGAKADKVSRGQWAGRITGIRKDFSLSGETPVVAVSSLSGPGKEEIWAWIGERIEERALIKDKTRILNAENNL